RRPETLDLQASQADVDPGTQANFGPERLGITQEKGGPGPPSNPAKPEDSSCGGVPGSPGWDEPSAPQNSFQASKMTDN
ncbi:hypothetical protein, partial [Thermomonas haemolytica]|uniref:hypothetical protein n=1 Tax=Thermomonas haemolytica TaxID=141949 RepID=UPI001A9E9B4F